MLRPLALTSSTFRKLREGNYVYVDKTEFLHQMITKDELCFLSRPRRFGKSLITSTLEEILRGNKELFEGLWISKSDYDWKTYGVIKLDFSSRQISDGASFDISLNEMIEEVATCYEIEVRVVPQRAVSNFHNLVKALYKKFGQVALIIDEYDSPILSSLHAIERAKEIRDAMRSFFSGVKSLNAEIKFAFITGVSSFAKAGLFSGLNNLQILNLRDDYGAVCGYTDEEVDFYFKEHIQEWADKKNLSYNELRAKIKEWYNGYRFGEEVPSVYNPFSLMHALNIRKLENFWFESGNPAFLIDELRRRYQKNETTFMNLDALEIEKPELGTFDVGEIPPTALLFQTGYLTIKTFNEKTELFTLGYPNYEVKTSLQRYLLNIFAHLPQQQTGVFARYLHVALHDADIEKVVDLLRQLFAQVPYQLHDPKEKFYHALLQMAFGAAGFKAQSEYSTDKGRIDIVLEVTNFVYIIEVKFDDSPEVALAQIKERNYQERFLNQPKPIILLGLSFDKKPQSFEIGYSVEKLSFNN